MSGEGGPRQAAHTITIDTPSLDQDDLSLGYRLGYGAGYETGFAHGWNARDNELQAFFGLYRSLSERRRHAELEAIRSDTTPRRCRDECRQCSACVRHAQATRNWAKYRSPDFPGGGR